MTESPLGIDRPGPKLTAESQPNGQGKRDPHPSRRRRKVLAALAGGLVLGLGTAATLAAWNDSEFANGTFSAGGDVDIQGSTDGGVTWSSSATAPGKTLSFSTDANNMVPGEPAYAPFAVRLSPGSVTPPSGILAGQLTVKETQGDLSPNMALYGWFVYPDDAPDHTCNPASLPTNEPFRRWWEWTPLPLAKRIVHDFTLSKNAVHFCLAVVVDWPSGILTNARTFITWEFRTKP